MSGSKIMILLNKRLPALFAVCWLAFAVSAPVDAASSESFHNALSLQGYTGILNTPSAHITDEGSFYALYSNQEESKWRQKTPYQDNFLFSVGFLNFVELGGRFFESPKAGRDLSANVKISSASLTRDNSLIPVIAVGVQDPGGGAVLLKTGYAVLSEDIWRLRVSAGYGSGPGRMKGAFAGGEFKVHDWVTLLGEYDTSETNVGTRIVLPPFWKIPISFTATAKTSLDYKPGNFDVAVGMSIPLGWQKAVRESVQHSTFDVQKPKEKAAQDSVNGSSMFNVQNLEPPLNLLLTFNVERQLSVELTKQGFLNVRVGRLGKTLVVEYENTIFNHNELDALGVVAGVSCKTATDQFDTLMLVVKKRNLQMVSLTAPLNSFRNFLERSDGLQNLKDHLVVDYNGNDGDSVTFVNGDNDSGVFNTSLTLAPGLVTFIGTEVGAFDYLLSLKPELTTMLWKGAVANARWDLPVAWSNNLDDGKTYRSSRKPDQLERLMLFQAVKPLSSVMFNLGAGMVTHERYGVQNEAIWSPGSGEHQFRAVHGWSKDNATRQQADLLLGSYRFYYSPLDLSIEGTAGKFLSEDIGSTFELKRFWEDTSVSFYYKDVKGVDRKKWQAVGIQLSFPLTLRKDMKPFAKLQLRGSEEWAYAQETTLKNNNVNSRRGELNYLPNYALATSPKPSVFLTRSYYNRDRLSESYIKSHLERLRDAWKRYGYY
jgi:hypothetical protein